MSTAVADERTPLRLLPTEDTLTRALNADLAQPLTFAVLAMVYAISRAPFLSLGYGTDPDAWRVALTGYWLWEHGEYYPSRLPGYPLHEFASAAVINGGSFATNSLTVAISLLGLWFFARIASELRLPNKALVVVGFAFTPLLWINSMTTMDYMWALTFILGAYYFLIVRQSFWAGVMLGLAVASRSTSLLMAVPLVLYMWRCMRRDEIRPFVVTVAAIALVAWTPVYWTYGPDAFNFYDSKVGYLVVLRVLAKECLGLSGAFAVVVAAAVSLPRLRDLPGDALRDRDVGLWLLAIALTVFSFLRLPHEAAYLIPVFPFGLLLMARYFRRTALTGAIAVIIIAGFVDLTSPGDEISLSALRDGRPGQGLVLSNRSTMLAQRAFVHDLTAYPIPDNSTVAVGFIYPQFAMMNRDRLNLGILEKDTDAISQLSDGGKAELTLRGVTYVWLLDFEEFERRSERTQIFYTLDAGRSMVALYDFRPGLLGAHLVDLGRTPSGGSGAARTDR